MNTILKLTLAALLAVCQSFAIAQANFPSAPIKIIVPFPAGGGGDLNARILAQGLSKVLNQSVIVENRPGAAGSIGFQQFTKAKPDGYTLLLAPQQIVTNYFVYTPKVHPLTDVMPVAILSNYSYVLITNPSKGIATLPELAAKARERPGQLNIAVGGSGAGTQLAAAMLMRRAGIKLTEVPFNGTGPALHAILNGSVDVTFSTGTAPIGMIRGGQINALGVTTTKRLPALPSVPTINDFYPGFEFVGWYGIMAPVGTPPSLVALLNQKIGETLNDPAVRSALEESAHTVVGGSIQDFEKVIAADLKFFEEIVRTETFERPQR